MAKRCFKCKKKKPLHMFYKHPRMRDGHLGKCQSCTKKDVRMRYRVNKPARQEYERSRFQTPGRNSDHAEYQRLRRMRFPGKVAAKYAVSNAIRDGRLKRLPCEMCGDPNSQAHHDDYRKKLTVRWLCFKHHRAEHGQQVA